MGTLSINCPLCCDEHFSSLQLLRDHILEVLNNLHCPACGAGVNSIVELADHIEVECGKTTPNIKEEVQQQSETEREQPDEAVVLESEQTEITEHVPVDTIEQDQNSDVIENTDGVTYMCVMCDIHFKSIEEHLEKYHDGEEVVLETEEAENEVKEEIYEDNQITEYIQEDEEEHTEVSQENANNENEYIEDRNIVKRKSDPTMSKYKANIAPRTENYTVENGKVRKITEEEAAEILDRNSIIQIHQCPRCCLQFPKLDHYVKHNCLHNKPGKKFRCVHCAAVFQTHLALNSHLKMHVNNQPEGAPNKVITLTPHTCDICNTMFPSFKSLRLHKKMHEPVKVKAVESPVTQNEAEPEAERQMFVCKICNNTYDMEYEEVHMKSHSDEEHFMCTTCNRQFATKENLDMHMKAHTNAKKFICSYCKKAFTTYSALHEHVSNQCQNRHYECQYCGRRFSRPHEKVKHERIHTGEKPHICQICGKAFRVSYCLTLHMRTHSGSRPYECPHCNKRFKSHSVYNHHLLIHSNVRAYKCPYCPKAFKTAVQLAGHKNSHIKPFSCTECNRPFASLYAVRAHMETHKRENNLKFDCWLCGATYARAFALKDHMKSQHTGEPENEDALVEMMAEDMEADEGDENNFSATDEGPATEIDEAV